MMKTRELILWLCLRVLQLPEQGRHNKGPRRQRGHGPNDSGPLQRGRRGRGPEHGTRAFGRLCSKLQVAWTRL